MRNNLKWAPNVYRLIDAALIGNFFDDPFLFRNQKILVKCREYYTLGTKGICNIYLQNFILLAFLVCQIYCHYFREPNNGIMILVALRRNLRADYHTLGSALRRRRMRMLVVETRMCIYIYIYIYIYIFTNSLRASRA